MSNPEAVEIETEVVDVPETAEAVESAEDDGRGDEAAAEDNGEVDLLGDDVPEWLKEFDARDKPISVKKESLDKLFNENPDAAQLVHNLRRLASDKVRAANEAVKAAAARERVLDSKEKSFGDERKRLLDVFNSPQLRAMLAPPEGEAPDEFTEEGAQWYAQKAFSEKMSKFMDALGGGMQNIEKEVVAANEQRAHQARVAELGQWRDSLPKGHWEKYLPGIKELRAATGEVAGEAITPEEAYSLLTDKEFGAYKKDVLEIIKRTKGNVSATEAYHLAKSKRVGSGNPNRGRDPVDLARARSREASVGTRPGVHQQVRATEPPKGLTTARQIAEWYEANPEAMEAVSERVARRY